MKRIFSKSSEPFGSGTVFQRAVQRLKQLGLTLKITVLTLGLLALAIASVAAVSLYQVVNAMRSDVVQRQERNIRVAATVFSGVIDGMTVDRDAMGNVSRIVMPRIPEFTDHSLIDAIGKMTGETVTVFQWVDTEQDFMRRTTNILKPDGSRAVGTLLGKASAVYPFMTKGQAYAGEAMILGKPYYTVYMPIFNPVGRVIGILYSGVEQDHVHILLDQMIFSLLVTSGVIFVAAASIALFLYLRMLGIVSAMANTMRRLAGGDRIAAIPGLGRGDELGAMADAVNIFKANADEVQRLAAERTRLATQAEADRKDMLATLAASFQQRIGSIVESMGSMVDTMQAGARTLCALAERTARQGDEAGEASDRSVRNVQAVAGAAEALVASIGEIHGQIGVAADQADDAVQIVRVTNETVEGLKQSTERIGAVLTLIQTIAAQTNLLALNATIEAARAGDAGKGFAVVANEVKSLANQTQKATEEIALQIQDMQTVTENAVAASERIGRRIDTINQSVGSISAAAEQQSASTQAISYSMAQVEASSQNVANNVEEVRQAADQTGQNARLLLDMCLRVVVEVQSMREEVTRFLGSVKSA